MASIPSSHYLRLARVSQGIQSTTHESAGHSGDVRGLRSVHSNHSGAVTGGNDAGDGLDSASNDSWNVTH